MKELAVGSLLGVDLDPRYTSDLRADTMIRRSVDVCAIFGWVMRDWKSWLAQRVEAIGIGLRLELVVPAGTFLQSFFAFSEPPQRVIPAGSSCSRSALPVAASGESRLMGSYRAEMTVTACANALDDLDKVASRASVLVLGVEEDSPCLPCLTLLPSVVQ